MIGVGCKRQGLIVTVVLKRLGAGWVEPAGRSAVLTQPGGWVSLKPSLNPTSAYWQIRQSGNGAVVCEAAVGKLCMAVDGANSVEVSLQILAHPPAEVVWTHTQNLSTDAPHITIREPHISLPCKILGKLPPPEEKNSVTAISCLSGYIMSRRITTR